MTRDGMFLGCGHSAHWARLQFVATSSVQRTTAASLKAAPEAVTTHQDKEELAGLCSAMRRNQ